MKKTKAELAHIKNDKEPTMYFSRKRGNEIRQKEKAVLKRRAKKRKAK